MRYLTIGVSFDCVLAGKAAAAKASATRPAKAVAKRPPRDVVVAIWLQMAAAFKSMQANVRFSLRTQIARVFW